jgi:coproporphyrinogen III oxidase
LDSLVLQKETPHFVGRTESILLSMPPMVSWSYRHEAAPGTPERALTDYFLVPRDWLAQRA